MKNSKVKIPKLKSSDLIECRGSTWRYLKEESGFWELELVKEGHQFVENPKKVWALPDLEVGTIKRVSAATLAPPPTENQNERGKHYKPLLEARRSYSLDVSLESSLPTTSLQCAIQTKPWQFEPWMRIQKDLPFPRILIADDVGLGKSTEAAIILTELTRRRRADRVLIIVPQNLCEKWQDELYERFGLPFDIYDRDTRRRLTERGVKNPWQVVERVIVSRDFVKRWENLKAIEQVNWDMVIIDECHHFVREKSRATTRVRELAERIVYRSPGLILLSATPFTGSKSDFHSLLKLIDPKFYSDHHAQKWDPQNPYLIRRLKNDIKDQGEVIHERKIHTVYIPVDDLSLDEKTLFKRVEGVLKQRGSQSQKGPWDHLLEETVQKRLSSSWRAFKDTVFSNPEISSWFDISIKDSITKIDAKQDSAKLRSLTKLSKKSY